MSKAGAPDLSISLSAPSARYSATKYRKENKSTFPPQLLCNGEAVLSFHRAKGTPRGNGYHFTITQTEAMKLIRQIVFALNALDGAPQISAKVRSK